MKKGSFTQLFTLLCYAVAIGAELVFSMLVGQSYAAGQMASDTYVYLCYLIPQLCYLVSIAVFALIQRIPAGVVFRPQKVKPMHYLYALLVGLGLFFVALLPNHYLQLAFASSGTKSEVILPSLGTAGEITIAILLICVLPAFGEEMLFRKTFCEGMKGNNEWVIVLLGGLFFSWTHFNLVQTVHQFVLGCVLCFLYVRTENVTLTVMIHMFNNLLALFLESWTRGAIDWGNVETLAISCVAGLVLMAAGLFLFFRKTKKVEGEGKVTPYTIGMIAFVGVVWLVSVITSFF